MPRPAPAAAAAAEAPGREMPLLWPVAGGSEAVNGAYLAGPKSFLMPELPTQCRERVILLRTGINSGRRACEGWRMDRASGDGSGGGIGVTNRSTQTR